MANMAAENVIAGVNGERLPYGYLQDWQNWNQELGTEDKETYGSWDNL